MKLAQLQQHVEEDQSTSFYISFSDLMVLLACFFLMVISMSKIEIGSFERIKSGITGDTKNTLVELAGKLKIIVDKDPGVPGVKVRMADDGVRLDLDTAALFDTGSAVVKKGSLEPLRPVLAEIIKTGYQIDIEGHTDDVRMYKKHGDELETNWSLSGRRASSVAHHLLDYGFKQKRVRIVGYAATRPKVSTKDKDGKNLEQARAENRRVSLLIH